MLKEITINQAIDACKREEAVYKLTPVSMDSTIRELVNRRLFIEDKQEPQKAPQKAQKETGKGIDHGKIVALYNAKWPPKKIADEMGCSEQTVRNHLAKEGL